MDGRVGVVAVPLALVPAVAVVVGGGALVDLSVAVVVEQVAELKSTGVGRGLRVVAVGAQRVPVAVVSVPAPGAQFRMRRRDYGNATLYNHSEARHGIAVYGSSGVLLDGLTVTETGGDGVYLSNILGDEGTPNRDVLLSRMNLTGNYRNAVSVISARGLS